MGADNGGKRKRTRCSMLVPIIAGFVLGGVATIGMILEDPDLVRVGAC